MSVADVEATAEAVVAAGGRMIQELALESRGEQTGIFADPFGVGFGAREGGRQKAADLTNEPGDFTWTELISDDVQAAAAFYASVLGWSLSAPLAGDPLGRREWTIDGRPIARLLPRPTAMPRTIPPYWDVFFAVEDPAAAAASAVRLRGKNLMPPFEFPREDCGFYRSRGTVFSVIKPTLGDKAGPISPRIRGWDAGRISGDKGCYRQE